MTTAIAKREIDLPARREPSIGEMIQAVTERQLTTESAAALDKLLSVYERMEDRKAEQAFNAAFVAMQSELPQVLAKKIVPNNDGSARYAYAPYDDIMAEVGPVLQRHGFAVAFSTVERNAALVKVLTLSHVGGHSRNYEFPMRPGKGPPGSSDAQAFGSSSMYSRRYLLCEALNIAIDRDDDARNPESKETVTPEQSDELERRCQLTNSNVPAFLKLAKAASFAEIPASMYQTLDEMLSKKERRGR